MSGCGLGSYLFHRYQKDRKKLSNRGKADCALKSFNVPDCKVCLKKHEKKCASGKKELKIVSILSIDKNRRKPGIHLWHILWLRELLMIWQLTIWKKVLAHTWHKLLNFQVKNNPKISPKSKLNNSSVFLCRFAVYVVRVVIKTNGQW